jgi:hypothetical protein
MENRPTPDYGTLGPDADLRPADNPLRANEQPPLRRPLLLLTLTGLLVLFGIAAASGQVQTVWEQVEAILGLQGKPKPASASVLSTHEIEGLDSMPAQGQAELLLERSINHYDGANAQIAQHLTRTPHFDGLFSTAINSDDLRVRAAAIEIDLAVYNAPKTPETLLQWEKEAAPEGKDRVTALWLIGLLGNRGVEPQRAFQILTQYIHDPDSKAQFWAVEGLAYLGTDEVIPPLLDLFRNDPSPTIRERAACSLAQSGMLSQEQRKRAVPRLIDMADDAGIDAQTHSWVFQALRDITGANVPSDANAWREWYSQQKR